MLDRKTPPSFVRKTDFTLIQPDKRKLANGAPIFFVTGGAQDVVKIDLFFKGGRWFEQTPGAAHFTANLLTKGTQTKSSFQIAQIFDLYGSHCEINAGLDYVSVSLYSLRKNLKPSLSLLVEVIETPSFDQKEVDQFKSIYLQNLKVNQEKTSFLASKYFRKNLFGNDHPYGRELEESDVLQLTNDALVKHHQDFFRGGDVFVSGKLDETDKLYIMDALSALKAGSDLISKEKNSSSIISKIRYEKDGAVQSTIRVGRKSIQRKHPDYAHVNFVSHILGGYFGSRLMKNIREEKGLTYGVYCSIHPLRNDSYFIIGADVDRDNVELTTDEIRKELDRLSKEPVNDEEMTVAKNHFIGSIQSEITTAFAHADKWKTIHLFQLPSDYYQQMIHSIESMDAQQVMEISRKYFQPENLLEVAVG